MKKVLGLIAAMAVGSYADYSAWSDYYRVAVHALAAGVTENLTNYPLLLKITDSEILGKSVANGNDIRFSSWDETVEYDYEIEHWSADTAIIWVRIPSILANTDNQSFKLHIGNVDANTPVSDGSAVFDTANGWVAVWHMNQPTTTVDTDSILDATANKHSAALKLVAQADAAILDTTLIGPAKAFRGNSQVSTGYYFNVDETNTKPINLIDRDNGPFTVSAWVRWRECTGGARMAVITKYNNGDNPANSRGWAIQTGNNGQVRFSNNPPSLAGPSGNVASDYFAEFPACTAGDLTYFSGTYDRESTPAAGNPEGMSAWLNDGAATASTGQGSVTQVSVGNNGFVYIGRLQNADRFFRGAMDEIRVSKTALSNSWKKLDYETQKPGDVSAIVSIGDVTNVKSVAAGRLYKSPINAHVSGNGVLFSIAGTTPGVMSIVDVHGRTVFSREVTAANREISWHGGKGVYIARFASKDAAIRFGDHKFTIVR